jgi:NAD(P)-dependent dehydrogenase (short-subunit alcohol dehydrogenase family)
MDGLGGLDILIHNVGGSAAAGGGALALSDDGWQHAFDTNLFAAVRLHHAFLPSMLKQGSGVIIHISSIHSEHSRSLKPPWRTRCKGCPD